MKKNNGFVLVEVLFSLLIGCIIVIAISALILTLSNLKFNSIEIQNRMGIIQLRNYLRKALLFEGGGEEISYYFGWEKYTLKLVNKRLIQQPGTLIFLVDIDNVYLSYNDDLVLEYCRKEKCVEEVIAYEPF